MKFFNMLENYLVLLTKMLHDERSPRVNVIDHMQNLGYPVVMKVTQWLVNLFVNAIPMPMQQAKPAAFTLY